MTHEETLQILSVLKAAYPSFYKDKSRQEALEIVAIWEDMFKDDNAVVVGAAVKALIATDTSGYPPHIGAVKEHIRKLKTADDMDESKAWALIRKAISNGLYGSQEEFEKLPPICKRIVGSPAQLKEWANTDTEIVQSVVASNVQRAFRTMQDRENERAKLPESVKQVQALISGVADRYALGDGND